MSLAQGKEKTGILNPVVVFDQPSIEPIQVNYAALHQIRPLGHLI